MNGTFKACYSIVAISHKMLRNLIVTANTQWTILVMVTQTPLTVRVVGLKWLNDTLVVSRTKNGYPTHTVTTSLTDVLSQYRKPHLVALEDVDGTPTATYVALGYDGPGVPSETLSGDSAFEQVLFWLKEQMSHTSVGLELVSEPFTIGDIRNMYQHIWGTTLDSANFSRKLRSVNDLISDVGVGETTGRGGRPPHQYVRGTQTTIQPAIYPS